MTPAAAAAAEAPGDDEEDDYMSMDLSDAPTACMPESSLQRRERLRRENEIRARPLSKTELAAVETAAREEALSTSLLERDKASKGLSMMRKMGFRPGTTLGVTADATAEPIRVALKDGRGGLGLEAERKRKRDEEAEAERSRLPPAQKARLLDPDEYRDRVRRDSARARNEKLLTAAQKVAQVLDEERGRGRDGGRGPPGSDGAGAREAQGERRAATAVRPLRTVNVLYRGLVRGREQAERSRRMRQDLEESLNSRLPAYDDASEDEDDRTALGKTKAEIRQIDDLDEEDAELDEFNALEPEDRLARLVEYLRKEHRYCFWCKFTYADEDMDGCPGMTEDEHD